LSARYKLSNAHCPIWEGLGSNGKKNAEISLLILGSSFENLGFLVSHAIKKGCKTIMN
jgi:hypothetical protein